MFTQFSQKAKTNEQGQSGFYDINSKTTPTQIKIWAEQSRLNDNLYGLSQCVFELYRKCLWSWNSFQFDSETYDGKNNISPSRPSLAQDSTASYFIDTLDKNANSLSFLLLQTDSKFWSDFYNKYSAHNEIEINSFFNLIYYVANNIRQLHLGFNNVATMAFAHHASVGQQDNKQNTYKNKEMKFVPIM